MANKNILDNKIDSQINKIKRHPPVAVMPGSTYVQQVTGNGDNSVVGESINTSKTTSSPVKYSNGAIQYPN